MNARTAINTLSSLLFLLLVAHTTAYQQQMWPPSRVVHVHPVVVALAYALGLLTLLLWIAGPRAPETTSGWRAGCPSLPGACWPSAWRSFRCSFPACSRADRLARPAHCR